MRRQRQFWLQTGVCQPSYPTRAIPRCVLRVAMLPSTTFCVGSAHREMRVAGKLVHGNSGGHTLYPNGATCCRASTPSSE